MRPGSGAVLALSLLAGILQKRRLIKALTRHKQTLQNSPADSSMEKTSIVASPPP